MTTTKVDTPLGAVLILAGGLSTRMGAPKALLILPTGETLLDYHVKEANKLGKPIFIADNQQGFVVGESLTDYSQRIIHIPDYQPMASASFLTTAASGDKAASEDKKSHYAKKPLKLKHSAGPLGAVLAGMQYALNTAYNDDSHQNLADKSSEDKKMVGSNKWLLVISCDSLVSAFDVWQQCCSEPFCSVLQSSKSSESSSSELANPESSAVVCLQGNQHVYPLLGVYRLCLANPLKNYLDEGNRRVMRFIAPYCHAIEMPQNWIQLSNLNTPEAFTKACQAKY